MMYVVAQRRQLNNHPLLHVKDRLGDPDVPGMWEVDQPDIRIPRENLIHLRLTTT